MVKKFIYIMLSCLIVFIIFSCGENLQTNNKDKSNVSENSKHYNNESLKFTDIDNVGDELKTLIWGSHGWSIWYNGQSEFIYAYYHKYLLRYNISENTIDRVVDISEILSDSYEISLSFSSDGRYGVVFNCWDENKKYNPQNIFLIDFDMKNSVYLADTLNDLRIEELPDTLQNRFDLEDLRWIDNDNKNNLDILNYILEIEYDENLGSLLYAKDKNNKKYEISLLRNSLINRDIPCVGIDADILGSLIPIDEEHNALLGYYKFVLIDITSDTIIQECYINTK